MWQRLKKLKQVATSPFAQAGVAASVVILMGVYHTLKLGVDLQTKLYRNLFGLEENNLVANITAWLITMHLIQVLASRATQAVTQHPLTVYRNMANIRMLTTPQSQPNAQRPSTPYPKRKLTSSAVSDESNTSPLAPPNSSATATPHVTSTEELDEILKNSYNTFSKIEEEKQAADHTLADELVAEVQSTQNAPK